MTTCNGKRKHLSELSAIGAAIRLSARRGVPLRVYLCPDCSTWHLTKRRRWVA